MPYLSAYANAQSWIAAALVTVAVVVAYIRRRYVKSTRSSYAARIEAAKTGVSPDALPYGDAVRRANKSALRWLAGLLIGAPTVLIVTYLFVSGLAVADRTLMAALGALTGVAVVLIGVFVTIREVVLRTIRHSGKK